MSQQALTNSTLDSPSTSELGRSSSGQSPNRRVKPGSSSAEKSGRIPSKAQIVFRRWRFRVFWTADLIGVSLYFYIPVFLIAGIAAFALDQIPYPKFMLSIADNTSLRTGPMVAGVWKWGITSAPLALAILSFSYTLVKDVSLSLVFTYNPIGKHFLSLLMCTLLSGLAQMARGAHQNPHTDAYIGDLFFLAQFLCVIGLGVWFVVDQFRRLAPTDEFTYCFDKISRFADLGLTRAKELGGKDAVLDVLNLIQVHYETMFQVLGTFVQRDMDVFYDEYLGKVSILTGRLVTAIQMVCRGQPTEYRQRVKFLAEKHFDHLLVLSQKHHGLEAKHLTKDCFTMLRQAAAYDKPCLVQCSVPLRTSVLTLVQRRERVTLMSLLSSYITLYSGFRSRELSAAVLYLYYAVLVEAAVAGDKVTLNELLHQLRLLEHFLPRLEVRWLYAVLWGAILKSIEHSAHESTGALLKTFVTEFDAGRASRALDRLLAEYQSTNQVRPIRIPVSISETLRDTRLREALQALNPEYEFIQGSLDYCLTKMIFLWWGQQRYLIHTKASEQRTVMAPKQLSAILPRHLFYLRSKLPNDKYGLTWLKDQDFVDQIYLQLCKKWKIAPEPLPPKTGLGPQAAKLDPRPPDRRQARDTVVVHEPKPHRPTERRNGQRPSSRTKQ